MKQAPKRTRCIVTCVQSLTDMDDRPNTGAIVITHTTRADGCWVYVEHENDTGDHFWFLWEELEQFPSDRTEMT